MEEKTPNLKSINESIIEVAVKLQEANLKKSGNNTFAKFKYFELADFQPTLNKLLLEEKMNYHFTFEKEDAVLTIRKGEESEIYKMPFVRPEKINDGKAIQFLGGARTYYLRYLLMTAFGVSDGEAFDKMEDGSRVSQDDIKKPNETPLKPEQKNYNLLLKSELSKRSINFQEFAEHYQINKETPTTRIKEIYYEMMESWANAEKSKTLI